MCLRFPKPEKINRAERRKSILDNRNNVKEEARRLDGHKCANPNCKAKDNYYALYQILSVHHIIKLSETVIDELWNLITLCAMCHHYAENGINTKDKRLTAREFMLWVLENKKNEPNYRHAEAEERLRRKIDR